MENQTIKKPLWLSPHGYQTLKGGYLLQGEEPYDMYDRLVAESSRILATHLTAEELASYSTKLTEALHKNWLCPASPVLSNLGTDRGLPISCYGGTIVPDSVTGIMDSLKEIAMQTKSGGGTAIYMGEVRARGARISQNGYTEGIIPFLKMFDATILGISQGGVRRGAMAAYLPITHGDAHEFIDMRRPTVEEHRRVPNVHHGICIDDEFMRSIPKNKTNSELWTKLIKARLETGEPYIFFSDNVNKGSQEKVYSSNLCSEIMLPTDSSMSFVCCLSSLNLDKYDEWQHTDLVQTALLFLNSVNESFIEKCEGVQGLEKARYFASKYKAIGLGVLGYHSFLQKNQIAFESMKARYLNAEIFQSIHAQGEIFKTKYAFNNYRLFATAPTVSNSLISGHVSNGIEPIPANAYTMNSAKGSFVYKNKYLKQALQDMGKDTLDVWQDILVNQGSVQHLDFFSDEEKAVFRTAREINQLVVVQKAAQRQKFIDQGQSLNLYFPINAPLDYINECHYQAWELGVKSLYYCRTASALTGKAAIDFSSCKSCEG